MYPIRPSDINIEQHFWGAFGKMEKEVSARWIVEFCQKNGDTWAEFPVADLEALYQSHGYGGFRFNGLNDGELLSIVDGRCKVSHQFVVKCFESQPREEIEQ